MTANPQLLRELADADPTRDLVIQASDANAQRLFRQICDSEPTLRPKLPSFRVRLPGGTGALALGVGLLLVVAVIVSRTAGLLGQPAQHYRLAALQRPRTLADVLPRTVDHALAEGGQVHRFGLSPSRSRQIVSEGRVVLWLVPGRKQTCLVETVSGLFGGAACSAAGEAATSGLAVFIAQGTIGGILPSPSHDVRILSADGTVVKVRENANGGFAANVTRGARTLLYRGIGGKTRFVSLMPTGTR